MIDVVVNGEPRSLPESASVAELVAALELSGKRIAVERNGEIVPRSRYADVRLSQGDRLEIVVAVGGG